MYLFIFALCLTDYDINFLNKVLFYVVLHHYNDTSVYTLFSLLFSQFLGLYVRLDVLNLT